MIIPACGNINLKYKISDKCIQCHACIWNRVCPQGAIEEHNEVFSINPDKCTDCGTCYDNQEYFCPVRAYKKITPPSSRKKPKKK
jgi:ferredoxin